MAPAGEIIDVRDDGSIWQIFYKVDADRVRVVNFDWRMFTQMYESESGRSFEEDYALGDGVAAIRDYFTGRHLRVEGDTFSQTVVLEDIRERPLTARSALRTPKDYLRRYPRLCAHIICHSLGYATPTTAATILMHAHRREPDYCEWIASCYSSNAFQATEDAIRYRHSHHGYMADFDLAYGLVARAVESGDEPLFGSWF